MSTAQRTLRRKADRLLLWRAADGRCTGCGEVVEDNWEADHSVPWSVKQRTNLFEMQVLCRRCNRKKGATMAATTLDLGDPKLNGRGWESYFNLSEDFRVQEGASGPG